MSNIKAIDELRRIVGLSKAGIVLYPTSKDYFDAIGECVDAIEREIAELQESWAQEAREHADDSAILAELAHENAELKREIAEHYMPLPCDADGVLIHVGDVVQGLGDAGPVQHIELWDDGWVVVFEYAPGQFTRYSNDAVRHVKPRTVEDVLRDCCNEWNEHCGDDWESGVYAKYADELRELIKEGEL